MKRLVRPFAQPLLARLGAQQEQIDQIALHLPVLLNAISTQNATAREFERYRTALDARLDEQEERLRHLTEMVAPRLDDHEARLLGGREELLRLSQELPPRLDDHEARLGQVAEELASRLGEHEARLVALAEAIAKVESRSEFIRREVMYETRYGSGSRGVEQVESRGVDLEKLAARGPFRLNLGSGHVPREGFVNVDARELDGVDVVADVRQLPFEPGTVEEIYSSHLVEHFPFEELRRTVLPHWLELLRPGGRLVAVTPDAEKMIAEAAAGQMPFDDLRRVTFGDQEYDGDFHFAMFTPDSLSTLLRDCGFTGVDVVEAGRPNGLCYEFEITAERPSTDGAQASRRPGTSRK